MTSFQRCYCRLKERMDIHASRFNEKAKVRRSRRETLYQTLFNIPAQSKLQLPSPFPPLIFHLLHLRGNAQSTKDLKKKTKK